MRPRSFTNVLILLALATTGRAAPPIELELATERGVQITAPHEWLQLLASIGVEKVRIRGARPGDAPAATNRGSADRPRYHVAGILTRRDQLRLPGGTFSRGDRNRLKDYFARLAADGAEALTAPRGMFGLTEKEIEAVFADLAQPFDFPTKAQPPRAITDRLQTKFALRFAIDPEAERALYTAPPVTDELKGLTAGTGLAIMLRRDGLALRPEKSRGQPIVFHIGLADAEPLAQPTIGKTGDNDVKQWPIGWDSPRTPGELAPSLMEFLNAEIDGYTLEETLAAVAGRIKIPLYLDHASLAANDIKPAKIQVRLARTRTFYKRVIDRVLAQARLGSELRVDEAGRPFLWITR